MFTCMLGRCVISSLFFFFSFFFSCFIPFLCNLQQYCDSAYNKLNSLQQKEFIDITKMNYIWRRRKKKEEREGDKHTCTHALTHARAHEHTHTRTHARARAPPPPPTHTHTQFQTKIQAIKRPNKQIKDDPNKIVLT